MGRRKKTETTPDEKPPEKPGDDTFSLVGADEAATAPKPRRGRKAKEEATPAPKPTASGKPTLTEEEAALATKYGQEIKPGSMHYDETRKKKVLTIFCAICKTPREIATQDCFQTFTCSSECKKFHKKANG
jgi:hypothetical protein